MSAIYQQSSLLSDEIQQGVLTDAYKITGGVVRYAAGSHRGQIVEHLKPVDIVEAEEAKGLAKAALDLVKSNKTAAIIGVAVAGVAAVDGGVYYLISTREPSEVKEFRAALEEYIEAVKAGALTLESIDRLSKATERVKERKDFEKVGVKLSAQDIEIFVSRVSEYTKQLAHDNSIKLDDVLAIDGDKRGPIIDLSAYLEAQRRIFQHAA